MPLPHHASLLSQPNCKRRLERENSTVARIDRPQDLFLSTSGHGRLYPCPYGECRIQTGCLPCARVRCCRGRILLNSPKKTSSSYSKALLLFGGLFLGSVFLSSVFAHNFQRAWVSSLLWHLVPVLFALSLAHVHWTRKKTAFFLGSLLTGGIVSCLVVMDQHYQWTEWSHGLPRTGLGGLIYNKNFAAEYHAPLLPVALGLIFYVRSNGFRIAWAWPCSRFFTCTDALLARGPGLA